MIERLVDAIRNEDIDAFGMLYANDAVMFEPLLPRSAREKTEIMEGEAALFRAFCDISLEVKNAIRSGALDRRGSPQRDYDGPLDLGVGEVPPTAAASQCRWSGRSI